MNSDTVLNSDFEAQRKKSKKPLLWLSLVSMAMIFAGLSSAYIVSRKRNDWVSFDLPDAFFTSTIFIVMSSVAIYLSGFYLKKNRQKLATISMLVGFVFGVLFVVFQFVGFSELTHSSLFFTGSQSTIRSSFIFGITGAHLLHVFSGIIVLSVLLFKQFKKKYSSDNMLGFELGATFWHFLDIVWIYIFFFFYFYG
jgi:cytochrome c oxidase subunit 3